MVTAGTTLSLVGSAVETSYAEEKLHTSFALMFQGHTKRGTSLINDPLLYAFIQV